MFISLRNFKFSEEILNAIAVHVRSMVDHGRRDDLRYVF